MKDSREGKKRMDLREAGKLLGLSRNGVRSRFKRGLIDGERDNQGKLWVYLDPSHETFAKPSEKVSKTAPENPDSEGFSAVIERLSEDLRQARLDHREDRERLTAEIEDLRAKLESEREMRHAAEIRAAEGLLAKLGRLIRREA